MRACAGTIENFEFTERAKATFFGHVFYILCHKGFFLSVELNGEC